MARLLADDGTKNILGKRIRQLRKNNNLSQEQIVSKLQLLGFDSERGVIKRIENGTRFVSDIEVKLLANFFGVSYEYLLDEELE